MSIRQVHNVRKGAAFPVSQADAVFQDDVGGIVLLQYVEHFFGIGFCIHLIKLRCKMDYEYIYISLLTS